MSVKLTKSQLRSLDRVLDDVSWALEREIAGIHAHSRSLRKLQTRVDRARRALMKALAIAVLLLAGCGGMALPLPAAPEAAEAAPERAAEAAVYRGPCGKLAQPCCDGPDGGTCDTPWSCHFDHYCGGTW